VSNEEFARKMQEWVRNGAAARYFGLLALRM